MNNVACTIDIKFDISNFNLNQVINHARANKYGSAISKKKLMFDLSWIIKQQVKKPLGGAYRVNAVWQVPNLNRDLDNLLLKSIFDCMQELNLLSNDNLSHIVEINHSFNVVKRLEQGVLIKFYEVTV